MDALPIQRSARKRFINPHEPKVGRALLCAPRAHNISNGCNLWQTGAHGVTRPAWQPQYLPLGSSYFGTTAGVRVFLFLFLLLPFVTNAQPNVVGKNFSAVEYYKPPHDAQMKSLVQGSKGLPDGHMLKVNDLKLQIFSEQNERQLLVEAPECSYDEHERSAYSPGHLRAQSGKGELTIEGEGFLWQQTNSSLVISNNVHTLIRPGLMGPSNAVPANLPVNQITNLDIFSDQFTYSAETGLGVFSGNVRVSGTNLSLIGGLLTVVVPLEQRQLNSITAEQDVTVEYEGVRAKGDRVRYDAAVDRVEINGQPGHQPSWQAGDREGRADDLLIDRTNKVFSANGHAWLKMMIRGQTGSGFLPAKSPAKPQATNEQTVEISCASYEVRTNSAVFNEDVQVRQSAPGSPQGFMHCDTLTARFAGTNELQKIIAEKHVVMEQETNRFTADQAVFDATAGILELTGDPTWRSGLREGRGREIRINPEREEMNVKGNAFMRLPAEEIASSSALNLGKLPATNSIPADRPFAEVSSDEYTLSPEAAFFSGNVRAEHPQMKWQCESVAAHFSTAEKIGRVVADRDVVFDLVQEKMKMHGTGNHAVYTFGSNASITNDFLELTGNPTLTTTNGIFRNSIIILDLANQRMVAPGRFQIEGAENMAIPNPLKKMELR